MFITLSGVGRGADGGLQGQVADDALDPVRLAERRAAGDTVTKRRQLRLRLWLVEQAPPLTRARRRPVAQPRRTRPANSEAARAARPIPKGGDKEGWAASGRRSCGVGPAVALGSRPRVARFSATVRAIILLPGGSGDSGGRTGVAFGGAT